MGVTPMAEEGETNDELQTWYEGTEGQQTQLPSHPQNLDQNPL